MHRRTRVATTGHEFFVETLRGSELTVDGIVPASATNRHLKAKRRSRRNRPVARAPSRATRWRRCWRGAARCTLSRTWSRRARKRLKVSAHTLVTQLQGIQKSRSAGPDHPSHGARAAAKIAAWRVNASPRRRGIPTQSARARARRRGGALGPWLATRRFAARADEATNGASRDAVSGRHGSRGGRTQLLRRGGVRLRTWTVIAM